MQGRGVGNKLSQQKRDRCTDPLLRRRQRRSQPFQRLVEIRARFRVTGLQQGGRHVAERRLQQLTQLLCSLPRHDGRTHIACKCDGMTSESLNVDRQREGRWDAAALATRFGQHALKCSVRVGARNLRLTLQLR